MYTLPWPAINRVVPLRLITNHINYISCHCWPSNENLLTKQEQLEWYTNVYLNVVGQ